MQETNNIEQLVKKKSNDVEIAKDDAKWIVIDGKIYDVSSFMKRHPGGENIMSSYIGQDATDAWDAFHKDRETTSKFLKPLYTGDVKQDAEIELEVDYRKLRQTVENAGLMTSNPVYFCRKLAVVLALEILGYSVLRNYGYTWIPYFTAAMCFLISQTVKVNEEITMRRKTRTVLASTITLVCLFVQATSFPMAAGSLNHDFGHLSVFQSVKLNRLVSRIVSGYFKGVGMGWLNLNHNKHHSQPISSTGYIESVKHSTLFYSMFGSKVWMIPKQPKTSVPEKIFYSLLLMLLCGFRTVEPNFDYMLKKQSFVELGLAVTFYIRAFLFLSPVVGGPMGALGMLLIVMNVESQLTFVGSYKGHMPCMTDVKGPDCWFTRQVGSSTNVKPNILSDWLFGTHSYEIEHHLFPTMPHHNIHLVAPMVKDLCKKHKIPYKETTMCSAIWNYIRHMEKTHNDWMEHMIRGYGL